jgi:hypothetical protein
MFGIRELSTPQVGAKIIRQEFPTEVNAGVVYRMVGPVRRDLATMPIATSTTPKNRIVQVRLTSQRPSIYLCDVSDYLKFLTVFWSRV